MNIQKILYYIATAAMSAVFIFSAYMYLTNYEMVVGFYEYLGFPSWIIYPSAILKLLGLVAIWSRISTFLKEWAYAGFFFDAVLAFVAHLMAGDGVTLYATVALVGVILSRILEEFAFKKESGVNYKSW